jgi:hypothetical protein
VPEFDLFLLSKARRQFAGAEEGGTQQPDEAETDEGIDFPANGHFGPTYHSKHA